MTDALDQEIRQYVARGYRIASQTDTSAQLVLPKHFSAGWAIFWLIIGLGVGFLLYLAIYLAESEPVVYLSLQPDGTVRRTFAGSSAGGTQCDFCGYVNKRPRAVCKRCHEPLPSQV